LSDTNSPPRETTEVLYGNENIQRTVLEGFSRVSKELDGCVDHSEVAMNVTYDAIWNGFIQLKKKGVRLRTVTEITSENISYVKKLMELFEVRHITGVKSNFGIIDRRECLLHSISHEDQPLSHAIITNSKPLVEAQQYLFETLWAKSIPAQYKIKEIEEGIKPDFIETIRDPAEIQQHIFQLIKSAKEELLLLFSTPNAFYRQVQLGIIQILNEAASIHGVNIRILIRSNDKIMDTLEKLKRNKEIKILELQAFLQLKLSTVIQDRRFSLEIEDKDDIKPDNSQATGLETYSNSESTVWTRSSIFETLWTQSELHQ
jgi:hypothetical protein